MRLIYLLREEMVLPMVVVMPPTSVRSAREYFSRLAMRPLAYYGVVTELGLEQERSHGSIRYSKATFKIVERLTSDGCQ
jgi:hypothetical protein